MALTPNMGMNLPIPTVTPGPQYATENNTAFNVVDSHNHTAGQGVPVPSSGLNINGTLTFQANSATDFRSTQYADNASPLALPADIRCIYAVNGDLYYNDGIGNQIQLTIGGAFNATSIGGIGGDYGTSTASVFYTSLNTTFTFWQASGIPSTVELGTVIVSQEVAAGFGVSLSANPAQSADYTMVLPTQLPSSLKIMTLDAAGNIGATLYIDGTTIKNNLNVLSVDPAQLGILQQHQFEANGLYSSATMPQSYVDGLMFFRSNATIVNVFIFNLTAGSAGTTEFDLKLASPAGSFSSIFSTTGKITSAAASNIWTDSGSAVAAQTGVTKPVLSTVNVNAGQALRFDILTTMTAASDCGIIVQYVPR